MKTNIVYRSPRVRPPLLPQRNYRLRPAGTPRERGFDLLETGESREACAVPQQHYRPPVRYTNIVQQSRLKISQSLFHTSSGTYTFAAEPLSIRNSVQADAVGVEGPAARATEEQVSSNLANLTDLPNLSSRLLERLWERGFRWVGVVGTTFF